MTGDLDGWDTWVPAVETSPRVPDEVPDVQVVALPLRLGDDGPEAGEEAREAAARLGADLDGLVAHHGLRGAAGETASWPVLDRDPSVTLLILGVGRADPGDLRRAGAALARAARGRTTVATSAVRGADDAGVRAFVEGLVLGSYTFSRHSASDPHRPQPPASRVVLAALPQQPDRGPAVTRGLATGRAGALSRTLASVPSNEKNPPWLADRARELASSRLEVEVWDEERLAADGFGGLLAVGRASATPPRLVRVGYTPQRTSRRTPHVVLVGKGITFDTGGLSLKPAEAMVSMKRDMTGAGVVLSVLTALEDLGCPVRVTGLLACAENAVDGDALRPGDVVRHYGGRTTEVRNTDAEGRLVMADALAYAVDRLDPTVLVDVATLTGAMKVALGQRLGGLFATDDGLAEQLLTAGRASGEPVWRMPLVREYAELLESRVADADNAPGGPGAIVAALFLEPFTGGLPWAHLDIASAGESPTESYEWSRGPTGYAARLLLHWLEQQDPLSGVAAG